MRNIFYALSVIFFVSSFVWAASTYTTNYSLTKPGVGDTGWGAAVNTNFDTIDTQMKSNSDKTASISALETALGGSNIIISTEIDTFSELNTLVADQTLVHSNSNIATATALASNPTDCSANQYANAIAANGNLTCAAISDADVPDTITISLAATATALAANGSNCSSGSAPLGVDASGAAESCTDFLENVVEDTTPQLGGNIDVNGKNITSASNGNVVVIADGTGKIGIGTSAPGQTIEIAGAVRLSSLNCTGNTNGGALTADANGDISCTDDDGGAGGSGDAITVDGSAIDTTAAFASSGDVDFIFADGGAGGPDAVTADINADVIDFDNIADSMTLDATLAIAIGTSDINIDSNTLFVDGSANRVGIGTSTPTTALDVSGTATATAFSGPLTGNVTGNADTATALAANGANCSSGNAPLGVDASGAVESCFSVVTSEADTLATVTARGNQSDTAVIVDVTGTEALLVRTDADAGDVLAVDTTNSRVTIGAPLTIPTGLDPQLYLPMVADQNILIDGSTNNRTVDSGVMRFLHTPAIENTRSVTYVIDANSLTNTHATVAELTATALASGEQMIGHDVQADTANSTGGVISALEVSKLGIGSAVVTAVKTSSGVRPVIQNTGLFGNVEQAWTYNGAYTDTTAAFNSTASDVTIFGANGNYVYIGMAAQFDAIEVGLATPASNPGVKPTFEFSDGAGVWTVFTPSDDTLGFRTNGLIWWDNADIPDWTTDTVNGVGSKYWIRITRTQASLGTVPVEDFIQVQTSVSYYWDENGEISVYAVAATTFTGALTGNASTASALAANGSNCSAGSAPLGVDASGAAESCTDFEEDLSNSAGLAAALSDETGTGVAVFGTSPTIATPVLTGKIDRNDVAVDDDDCTGEQGLYWYDTTDSAFEFCNSNSGTPTTIGAGSGDITDVFNCSSGDCASVALADGDLLDASGVTPNTTTEGIKLPQTTSCSSATAEGQICWDTDDDDLYVGDGSSVVQINGAGGSKPPKEIWWPGVALMPLEAGDSIGPIVKDEGTNLDQLTVDFDASTDECRTVSFKVPSDVNTGGTVTFRSVWYSASATSGNVILDFRHNSGVAEGSDPDAALTTEAASADAVQGTAGQITTTTWTETITNLGWSANEVVEGVFCRDANNASDTMTGDSKHKGFGIEIPRS